jgi:hypothetical protein
MTIRSEWPAVTEEETKAIYEEYAAVSRDRRRSTAHSSSRPSAKTVRVKNGSTLVTDGPFAETKEALGGYYLVEADSIDEALKLAAKIPSARLGGSIEVRPIIEM